MVQIIPKNSVTVEHNWQKELSYCFTDPKKLLEHLQLDTEALAHHGDARKLFALRVPRHFVGLMEKGNWQDPLLRQVMPLDAEFNEVAGFSPDPLQEHDTASKGLLHKYQSRVLLLIKTGCAVNCRYCFRRHFPYAENALSRRQWQQNIDYIKAHPQINEVIYSGGDPLMAKDEFLGWLTTQLEAIPHVTRLRIHTRLPVVLPERIDTQFVQWITQTRLKPVLVLHINHANEVSSILKERIEILKTKGVTVLNQGVLLKGVNDSSTAQVALSEALFDAGILPYYLFLLDKVQGAAHFEVTEPQARAIMHEMIKRLPGFLVPKLTREIGGQPGKTPIDLLLQPQN
ncbi:EF-P beta-lysylation protein EpmB [Alteromonas lipotrueiana]|uniref:EF-P beta-lysylation protein EpmB n=1 Tax=Alteromonas lipotrueiana TaxID=2803815 RepID=UPI001C485443